MARRQDSDDDAPWLAEASPRAETRVSRRSLFWTLAVLLSLAAVAMVGAIMLLSKKDSGSTEGYMEAGQAPLITAESGPYKVAPADPKGLAVEGQDQTIYAAGEGIDEGSVIDQSAVAEAPLPRPGTAQPPGQPPGLPQDLVPDAQASRPAAPVVPAIPAPMLAPMPAPPAAAKPPPVARPAPAAVARPAPAAVANPAPPLARPSAPPAAKAGTVQLGAFSTAAKADAAWAGLAARHPSLGAFGKRVSRVESGGQTLWRLRASGGNSAELCARLKAAGDACTVLE